MINIKNDDELSIMREAEVEQLLFYTKSPQKLRPA